MAKPLFDRLEIEGVVRGAIDLGNGPVPIAIDLSDLRLNLSLAPRSSADVLSGIGDRISRAKAALPRPRGS